MSAMLLTKESLGAFKNRLDQLTPQSERRFGTLDVVKMMRHMRNVMESALGEVRYPDKSTPVVRKLLFYTFCHVITTWPKGKIKAPDFWTPPVDHEFEDERRLLSAAMDRFVEAVAANPRRVSDNPFFGPLTMAQWSRLNGIHLNHHLRQFGVEP